MKQPPWIKPAIVPGPDYDPMDAIVQNLENIESFLSYLADNFKNLDYLKTHLPSILSLRRTLSEQFGLLINDPYNYPHSRLEILHEENEKMFIFIEGAVGAIMEKNKDEFNKCAKAAEETLLKLDNTLTP